MKILFVTKYPPIEGGVSSSSYWTARAFGERGVRVHVVTNALCVEEAYREKLNLSDPKTYQEYQPQNVSIFSVSGEPPRHIPYSSGYLSRIINLGLRVIGEQGADVIFAHYLEPYGVAGLMLKELTGIPLLVRHAGSDIYRLLAHEDYSYLLGRVLQKADGVFMSQQLKMIAQELKITPLPLTGSVVDTKFFAPGGEPFDFTKYGYRKPEENIPVVTYIGKVGAHKGVFELLAAVEKLKEDFRLVLVSNGGAGHLEKRFKETIARSSIASKIIHIGFIPPWEIPKLLRSSTMLVHLEHNFPIPIHSPRQPYEAIAAGTPLLLSHEMYQKIVGRFSKNKDRFVVVKNPTDIGELAGVIKEGLYNIKKLQESARVIRDEFLQQDSWEQDIDDTIKEFERFVKKRWFHARL